jgi:antagonist of KipI
MTIRVIRPGLFTTVQDSGRWGWQRYGVAVGGPMDRRSHRIANLLVGNTDLDAALEIAVQGPRLHFERESVVAVCGGQMSVTVDKHPIPMWRPVYLPTNSVVDCGTIDLGCRAYLAVAGGFDVPVVLGSRSTYVAAELGGVAGRALKSGDALTTGEPGPTSQNSIDALRPPANGRVPQSTNWCAASVFDHSLQSGVIRVIPGVEFDRLSSESQQAIFQSEFEITARSNRMGFRLCGPAMGTDLTSELISEGVAMGTVQLPPDGQLIVLMADCATTGGYPKVAHVVSVDLPQLAQCRPGTKLRFEKVDLESAHHLCRAAEADMNKLRVAIQLKFGQR